LLRLCGLAISTGGTGERLAKAWLWLIAAIMDFYFFHRLPAPGP
jgi:hypothetical protein